MNILDIGCGNNKVSGAIGIDRVETKDTDIVHDVAKGIPFPDESFNTVYMNSVLEHLPDTVFVMEEIYRVLKPAGIVHIIVPHYTSINAFLDPTHCKFFSIQSMIYFKNGVQYNYYSKARFDIIEAKFIIKDTKLKFIQPILNIRPGMTERLILCFLPIDTNIYWKLRKGKKRTTSG